MAIGNFESVGSPFVYGGKVFLFDTPTDYSVATLSTLSNPKYIGQIVEGSTALEGDEATSTAIKDEQGNIITSKVMAGTEGFSIEISSTSDAILAKFLKASTISGNTFSSGTTWASGSTVTGWGQELPVFTAPFAILNDEKNISFVYPKCKCVSNIAFSDGLYRVKAVVSAQYINTAGLKTSMKVTGAVNEA